MSLSVKELVFSYSPYTEPVLDHVSFELEKGRRLAILGPNGAGKTTLLKGLNRLLRLQSGRVEWDGVDLLSLSEKELARRVAYVPQKVSFSPCTVFDAVLMGRHPYLRGAASEQDLARCASVLETIGLAKTALRDASRLSGGEQQKVAIARALVQEAPLLLFDEPTSNLDMKSQAETADLLLELSAKRGLTVIATMHDINLALRFADRFLLMKEHRLFAFGGREILTEESIAAVYGIDASFYTVDGRTVILPK